MECCKSVHVSVKSSHGKRNESRDKKARPKTVETETIITTHIEDSRALSQSHFNGNQLVYRVREAFWGRDKRVGERNRESSSLEGPENEMRGESTNLSPSPSHVLWPMSASLYLCTFFSLSLFHCWGRGEDTYILNLVDNNYLKRVLSSGNRPVYSFFTQCGSVGSYWSKINGRCQNKLKDLRILCKSLGSTLNNYWFLIRARVPSDDALPRLRSQ